MANTSGWKRTPKAKIYEALSAVADERVRLQSAEASVDSSDRAKTYRVIWNEDKTAFGANDNASYFVGYMGYPVIAVLLALGKLPFDADLASHLRGFNWNQINQAYKRRYDEAVDYVLGQAEKDGANVDAIRAYADETYDKLTSLALGRLLPPGEPPKRA